MPFTTLPKFSITFNNQTHDIRSVDFKNISSSLVVTPDFLDAIAEHDKAFIRAVAAEHPNTSPETLTSLLYDSSPIVYFAAIENPYTPFKEVFLRWHRLMPTTSLASLPAKVDREEDYMAMLENYDITLEDLERLPMSWLVSLLGNHSIIR